MDDARSPAPLHQVFLSLGSNIDPETNLPAAVRELSLHGKVRRVSRVWETVPLGLADQPNFLNAVLWLETPLPAEELWEKAISRIEAKLGRVRTENRNAPRTIDIDIMLFDRDKLRVARRRIPDPEVLERPFIAIALAEIAPDHVHPETGETLRQIAGRFDPAAAGMRLREDVRLSSAVREEPDAACG